MGKNRWVPNEPQPMEPSENWERLIFDYVGFDEAESEQFWRDFSYEINKAYYR